MLKNMLLTGLRNLFRNRLFSLINVFGLAIGMASVLTVAQYVRHELSYDRNWENGGRIDHVLYRVDRDSGVTGYLREIPDNFSDVLIPQLPGIEASTRIVEQGAQVFDGDRVIRGSVTFVEPGFFTMFAPKVLEGDQTNFFPGLDNVVLTESAAKKYFGDRDPLGEFFVTNLFDERRTMVVTGVIADLPSTCSIEGEVFAPYQFFYDENWSEHGIKHWQLVSSELYVMRREGVTLAELEKQIPTIPLGFEEDKTPWGARLEKYRLQPIHDVHVAFSNPQDYPTDASAKSLRLLALIGLIILALACVNFTTLSIGQAATRLREVGVRKVLGAGRRDLRLQFWTETAVVSLLSLLLALPLTEFILPGFRALSGSSVQLQFDGVTLLILAGIWALTTLFSGLYPSLALSGFSIISAMRGETKIGGKGTLRRTLVFVQLAVAIGLLTSTLVMVNQMRYVQKTDLGFHGEQVVILDATTDDALDSAGELLRSELASDPGVLDISHAWCSFKGRWIKFGWSKVESVKDIAIYGNVVEQQYKDVMQFSMAAGRWFREGDAADVSGAVVINETMANLLGGLDIVGQTYPELFGDATIVGVVRDFNFHNLTNTIEPLVLVQDWEVIQDYNSLWIAQHLGYVYVRLAPEDIPATMRRVERAWKDVVPDAAFQFSFLQDEVDAQYRDVTRWNRIMSISSGLAILIAVLGLIGISAMQVARRTHEIGVRKVLGASLTQLLSLLSHEVLLLVGIANLIAWPVAWWLMHRWLENFAYKIALGWQHFVAAGALVMVVALVTVSLLSLRVASINPVETLRSE